MKTILITGGTKGVGRSLVELLLRSNNNVIFVYKKNSKIANQISKKYPKSCFPIKCDLAKASERKKIFLFLKKKRFKIDHLINNAAYDVKRKKFASVKMKELKEVFEINVFAIYDIIKGTLPFFQKKGWKTIINITSTAAKFGGVMLTHYAPTKAAIENLTVGLSKEFGDKKIRVINVAPGVLNTKTQNIKNKKILKTIPLGRLGSAVDIAESIIWLLSEKANYINGTTITISGGR